MGDEAHPDAVSAVDEAIAAAEVRVGEGAAHAQRAYALARQILNDDEFKAIIELDRLVAAVITEGLEAYTQVARDAALADERARTSFEQFDAEFRGVLGGRDAD